MCEDPYVARRLRRWRAWVLALIVCVAAAELAARLDDWLFSDVPLFANPAPERRLVLVDTEQARPLRSRFAERVIDTVKKSELLKSLRVRYSLSRELASKGDDYIFRDVPPERLRQFVDDLEKLADAVADKGATPVLVTH